MKNQSEWTDYMWNPTPGSPKSEALKPLGKKPMFARYIIGFDLFGPETTDGHIMRVWSLCAELYWPSRQVLIRTTERARLETWFRLWCDVDVADAGAFKGARGPAAVRAAHTCGRAELFARMLDVMGEPPPGCAYPLYDWMQGPLYWDDMLPGVTIELDGEKWHPSSGAGGRLPAGQSPAPKLSRREGQP